jgi:hypothetical protein
VTTTYWILLIGVIFSALLVLRRIWPFIHGRSREKDDRATTMNRWNTYIVPMVKQHLTEDMLVGLAGTFTSQEDGSEYITATWSLHATVMPDVDYIAIAPPDEDGHHQLLGFIKADDLRRRLGDYAQPTKMFGHTTWVYVWTDEADYGAISGACIPKAQFFQTHDLAKTQSMESP